MFFSRPRRRDTNSPFGSEVSIEGSRNEGDLATRIEEVDFIEKVCTFSTHNFPTTLEGSQFAFGRKDMLNNGSHR